MLSDVCNLNKYEHLAIHNRNDVHLIQVSFSCSGGGQGFIQDFQFGGGDVVCGLTGMGEYFSQVTPRNGAKSIVVSFC